MGQEQPEYLSYLLRLWRVSGEGEAVWRASLESPHTGERHGFAGLTDLFTFLKQEASRAAQRQDALDADEKGGAPQK
jgi:hypothetical protein